MSEGLRIADDLTLPVEVATDTSAILARKGAGKTYTAAVLAEEDVRAGIPFAALDPMGAFWGLRSSADGLSAGLPVTIIGGEHGDVPLEPTGGKVVADLVVDTPSWYVIDLSGVDSNAGQDRFACDFAERLYRRKAPSAQRAPLHLIIDEADSFAPQNAKGRERMLGAYEAIARRGRIRGIGSTWITQRPAVLNKNVLTQADVLICLQITSPQDRKAVDEWAKGHSSDEERLAFLAALATLKRGEAWVWAPNILDSFRQVQIRQRETWDSSATPKPGEQARAPVAAAEVDLEALAAAMAETVERAKASDPEALRQQAALLQSTIAAQARKIEGLERSTELGLVALDNAIQRSIDEAPQPFVPAEVGEAAEAFWAEMDGVLARMAEVVPSWRAEGEKALQRLAEGLSGAVRSARPLAIVSDPVRGHRASSPARATVQAVGAASDEPITGGAMRMLAACAQYPGGLTRSQVGTLADVKKTGGTFTTYLGRLKRAGLLVEEHGRLFATEQGMTVADVAAVPSDPAGVLEHWRSKFGTSGARRMLDVVADAGAAGVTRAVLAERAGITGSGGTFTTYLGRLRTNGLVEESGGVVRLAEWLVA